jgi:hypothetical protein
MGKLINLNAGDCVIFIKTYHGKFPRETINSFYKTMDVAGLQEKEVKDIGEDSDAAAKSWVAREPFSQYFISLYRYDVVSNVALPGWIESADK